MSRKIYRHLSVPTLMVLVSLGVPVGSSGADEATDVVGGELETVIIAPDVNLHAARLSAVESYMNSINTLKARFQQRGPDGKLTRGMFHMSRPGKVRFEYEEDVPLLIVSDGRTINMVDYELRQVTKWPIKDTPLALLVADEIVLGKNVTLVASGPGELANMISITAKDPKKPEQGTMTLLFSGEPDDAGNVKLTLRAWQVIDTQGALTTISLAEPETNLELDENLWSFKDPRADRFKRRNRRR